MRGEEVSYPVEAQSDGMLTSWKSMRYISSGHLTQSKRTERGGE